MSTSKSKPVDLIIQLTEELKTESERDYLRLQLENERE